MPTDPNAPATPGQRALRGFLDDRRRAGALSPAAAERLYLMYMGTMAGETPPAIAARMTKFLEGPAGRAIVAAERAARPSPRG